MGDRLPARYAAACGCTPIRQLASSAVEECSESAEEKLDAGGSPRRKSAKNPGAVRVGIRCESISRRNQ